jgi:glucosamine 6-phosphate synthetase-like amidotransferase/phosphosugar isomerase protein
VNYAASSHSRSSTPTSPTRSSPCARVRRWLSVSGDREFFVASDIPPILQHTRDVFFLGDGEIAIINKDAVRVVDFEGNSVQPSIQRITWDPIMAEKGGFKHFMLKEIYEQPRSVRDTVQGRVSLDTGRVFLDEMNNITEADFKRFTSIKIAALRNVVACGTRRQVHDRATRAHSGRRRLRVRVSLSQSR